jgi:hypothetical protein
VYADSGEITAWNVSLLAFMQISCILAWFLNIYWFKKMYLILRSYMKDGDVESADKFTTSSKEDAEL